MSSSPDVLRFVAPPLKIKVGRMETPYHKMQLRYAGIDLMQEPDQGLHQGQGGLPVSVVTNHREGGQGGHSHSRKDSAVDMEEEDTQAAEEDEEMLARGINAMSTAPTATPAMATAASGGGRVPSRKGRSGGAGRDPAVAKSSPAVLEDPGVPSDPPAARPLVSPAVTIRDRVKRYMCVRLPLLSPLCL